MSPVIDKEWFLKKLADSNRSLSELARALEIDKSAASRMLSGERKMRMEEAGEIARFLNAPVGEVMKHAGVSLRSELTQARVLLAATINETGKVERLKEAKPLADAVLERAYAAMTLYGDGNMIAAQIRASTGALAMFDDAVLLFKSTEEVEPSAIGCLSICRTYDGDQMIAKIERARKTGEARIVTATGKVKEAVLQTATAILAIIP